MAADCATPAGREERPGRTAEGNRLFAHAYLWAPRSGTHWHDPPQRYSEWKSIHKRFGRWADKGLWERVFAALIENPDTDYVMLDTTLVRDYQQAAGEKKGARDQTLARSRGGLTTKIHPLVDARGPPLKAKITPVQQGHITP